MAITRTGTNLAGTDFVPEIWEKKVLINFYNTSVASAIVNRNYEGSIKNAGDTVNIRTIGSLSLGDYNVNATINWTDLPDDTVQLVVDQSKYEQTRTFV